MNSSLKIPLAIVLGGVIIAIAVYASVQRSAQESTGDPSLVRPVGATDHILGNPAARVKIVEYSDFDCEFCKSFHQTLHQIIVDKGAQGQVAWVYRQFPLFEVHPNALSHAKAAECAAEVGGNDVFWKFADALYAAQPADRGSYGRLAAASGAFGDPSRQGEAEADAFATCYASESASKPILDRIMADRQNALDIGAQGTPYSLILVEGKPPVVMNGAYSYDAVKELVDRALAR